MKKVVAVILVFMFCFGCVAVFGMFGEGQMHVHAGGDENVGGEQPGTTTTQIEQPTVIIRYWDGVDGPIYDFTNKTVTLKILVKDMDGGHCRNGLMTIKYDKTVFDYSSVSGTFMGVETFQTDVFRQVDDNGLLTLSVVSDTTEPYYVASEIAVTFSFSKIDYETMADHNRVFELMIKFSGSKYKEEDNIKTKNYPVVICPHKASDLEVKDVAATCCEYSHRDTVCKMCGTVINSVTTGNTYSDHVYDYENIVRYVYANGYTECDPMRTNNIVAEVRCQVCHELQWVSDLEFHIGLDTSVKKYDAQTGQYYYTCAHGHRVIAKIQSAGTSTQNDTHVHTYGDPVVTKQPTCTEAGEQKRTCTVCNDVKIETIPAKGHTFGDPVVTKQPTCTEAGESVRTCSVCGAHDTPVVIPALGHDFSGELTVTVPATCSATGTGIRKCSRCDAQETVTIPIDPTAHSYGEWVTTTQPTCITKEIQTHTCSYCGHSETRELDYGAHEYTSEVTLEPTCYDDGVRTYTCKYCGDTYDEPIECAGHKFGAEISDGKGTTTKTCTECGLIVSTTVTSKKTTKAVSHGPFTLTINDTELAQKDIQLLVTYVDDRASDEYLSNVTYLNALNAVLGKSYSIQNIYHVTLFIDGVESKITSDMTLSLALNSALEKSKTAIVYYTESGSSTMITNMSDASRKKLVVTMPGKALETAANDTIILAVEGTSVTPVTPSGSDSTGQVTPPPPSTSDDSSGMIVPIVLIGVAVVVALTLAIVVIKGGKKGKYDF